MKLSFKDVVLLNTKWSLVLGKGYAEPALLEDNSGIAVQFERVGYFFKDPDSTPDHFVFNKTTSLKDSFKF